MEQLETVEGLIQEKPQASPASPADYVAKTEGPKYYGDALNDTNINEVVGDEIPHVVILVGFPKYGKSTFVASLYHKALTTGCVGDYMFVDSDTLAGFERRAQVRDIELKIKDRIDRTPVYADYFLSMLFVHSLTKKRIKLVLSDRSGENYLRYAKSETDINQDLVLKNAVHIIFFLDASKIASDKMFDLQDDLSDLILRMNKYGAFDGEKFVDIVYNKADTLQNEETKELFRSNAENIENIISKKTQINKKFEISSLNAENEGLNNFFKYLLSGSTDESCIDEALLQQINWVKNKYNKTK